MLISIIFSILYLCALALCVWLAWRGGWVRALLSLLVNAVSFGEAFLLSRGFTAAFGQSLSNALKEGFLELLSLRSSAMVRETAMLNVSSFAIGAVLGMASFLVFFGIAVLLNSLLKRLLFRLFSGKKYSGFAPKKKLPGAAIPIALVSFFVTSFAILYPVGAAASIAGSAAKTCGYKLPASVLTNPVSKLYGFGGRGFMDIVAKPQNAEFTDSEELSRGAEIYISLRKVAEGKDADGGSIEQIAKSLKDSFLLTDFSSELVANAANSWKNGLKYLNRTPKLPEGRSGELVRDVLEILSGWKRENLVADIDTAINVYKLLQDNGIRKLDDGNVLFEALADEDFCEGLFLELSRNGDFIAVIPKVMRFGIGSAVDAMEIEMQEEYLVEFDAESLTEEEWRYEAKAFSTLIGRMNAMNGEGSMDVIGLLSDLYELRESKLLSNLLINLLIQLLANMGGA